MTNPPKIPISHGEIPENPYQLLKKKKKNIQKTQQISALQVAGESAGPARSIPWNWAHSW